MRKRFIILFGTALIFLLINFINLSSALTNVSDCAVLNTANETYTLNISIDYSGDETCIDINATNVTFDCQGYTIIYGNASGGQAIFAPEEENHIVIQNCIVIQNTTASGGSAIVFGGASQNGIAYNNTVTIYGINSIGITIDDNSVGMNISSNNITTSGANESQGIYISQNGSGFDIDSNIISILGNESSGILASDSSSYGIISNNVISILGNLNIRENFGRGGIFLETGTTGINITSNTITTTGVNSTAIFIWGNKSLVYNNVISTSDVYSRGIFLSSSEETNVSFNNITTSTDNSGGIFVEVGSNDIFIINNKINTSGTTSYGISLDSCSNGDIASNNLTGTGSYGIYLNDCTDSLVYSNTISNAESYGIYDYISSSSNISSNTVSGTTGTGDYVYGIRSQNATAGNIESNILYGNDEGSGTYCGGLFGWMTNVTLLSNTIYGNLNTSCTNPWDIGFLQVSGNNSIAMSNNIINSSSGNNSVGVIFFTGDGSGTDTIVSSGNIIRNSDTCLHFEIGNFAFSGATLINCSNYDSVALTDTFGGVNYNTTLTLINVSLNISKLNVNQSCNITLQQYIRGYVSSNSSGLSGATAVLVNNNSAEEQWSNTTNASGYTTYGGATYYFYNSTGGFNYSTMTVTGSKSGYDSSSITTSAITKDLTINVTLSLSEEEEGGSGGGTITTNFWIGTKIVADTDFQKGYNADFSKKTRARVKIGSQYHYMGVIDVKDNLIIINVSSTPQQATLEIGEEEKFDVTDDNYYDLLVKLNSINTSTHKANITITSINEEIPKSVLDSANSEGDNSDSTGEDEEDTTSGLGKFWVWIGIIFVVLILCGAGILFYLRYVGKIFKK